MSHRSEGRPFQRVHGGNGSAVTQLEADIGIEPDIKEAASCLSDDVVRTHQVARSPRKITTGNLIQRGSANGSP